MLAKTNKEAAAVAAPLRTLYFVLRALFFSIRGKRTKTKVPSTKYQVQNFFAPGFFMSCGIMLPPS
jgi:hypothetical protein